MPYIQCTEFATSRQNTDTLWEVHLWILFSLFLLCPTLQHDYKPKNVCFTDLSMTYCVRVEGQGMLL